VHFRRLSLLLAALVCLLAVNPLAAQVAGRLSGTVVDQSGAAVPGASVSVYVAGGKEPVLSGQTNEAGVFSFVTVRPDTYDVAIESKGFTRTLIRGVKVSPVQETSTGPVKLEVQAATTTVEVASDVQAVQLSNAEVASTVTSTQVQNLPVLGRQVSSLLVTQAGVSSGNNTTNVNGMRPSFSNLTLDGINIQDNFSRTNDLDYAPMRTTIDQIAEITAATSNPNIALGGGASQFVLSTKSGSNAFHGSVYWYNRNSALAANDWFNNQSGTEKSRLNLNQPGAALGGRIIRDKLFFYTNYELYRDKEQTSILRTVLTDSARSGVYTYRDTAGNLQTKSLTALRGFSIDPTIKSMIDQLPAANAKGTGDGLNTSGYRFNARGNEFRDQFVYKSDYYLNAKNSFSGTYNYIKNPTDRPDQGAFYTAVPPVSNTIQDHLMSLSWRWMAAPTLTNELRGGFLRSDTAFVDSNSYAKFLVGGLIFSNPNNTFLNQGRKTNTYNIQDNANWSHGRHEVAFGFQSQILHSSPFNDAGILPAYTLGISAANTNGLTATDLPGIRSSDLTTANGLYADLAGIISSAAQTFNVTSTTSGFVPGATNLRQMSQTTYAAYVMDKLRLRPNLTVNVGLRYEYWTPIDEKNGLFLAPRLENGSAKDSVLDPNAILDFIGGPSGRPFYHADRNNFAPNIGFAWDPFKKGTTSIRGGYSISYVNDNLVTTFRAAVSQNSGLAFGNTMSNLTASLAAPPAVVAPVYKVPRTLQDNFAITSTSFTGMPDPNVRTPYVHQWNFGVEQNLKGTILAVRYIGNRSTDLLRSLDYNQVNINANGFLADFQRAQNNGRLSQAANGKFDGSYNPAIPGSQQLTVFPLLANGGSLATSSTIQQLLLSGQAGELANQYMVNKTNGSVSFWPNPYVQGARVVTNGGFGNYHALQIEATKRNRAGLQAQFSYTFGKALGNANGDSSTNNEPLLDNNNPGLEYARTPFDLRHVFKANFYYELPYGKGKHWSGNRVLNAALGGWSVAGIWNYTSGAPFSVLSGYGTLNRTGNSTEHLSDANNTASVYGPVPSSLTSGIWKTGDTVYFINPSIINPADGRGAASPGSAPFQGQVFFNPGAGTVGNLQRRMFDGPWQWSFDASVKKTITIHERHHIDLHGDLFNFMNHPTFYVYPSTGGDYGFLTPFNINSTAFGQVTGSNFSPRRVQIGAYYRF
jgi:hypothetical protein